MGFILAEQGPRVAMNKSFPRTQVLIQSVQRQVETLISRTEAYKMEVSKDWKTFTWSRISLLSHTAAGWKSACSQILRGVLESRIQIHPAHGQQTWMMYGTNTDLTKK